MKEYFLGVPMFANPAWRGTLFTRRPKPNDSLRQYASVFNSVEGNNTFYGLPSTETIQLWRQTVPDDFRFCLKIPRTISHESDLGRTETLDSTRSFLEQLEPLRDRIARVLVQLPPSFDGTRFTELADYLQRLPDHWKYAVEPRHLHFFEQPYEADFLALLRERDVSRCLFDTSTLHDARSVDPHLKEAQRKKPRLPRRTSVTNDEPMIRFIGLDDLPATIPALRWLADIVANWIQQGRRPFVFIHTPNDAFAPQFARAFHEHLRELRPTLQAMPAWPGESETVLKQKSLF